MRSGPRATSPIAIPRPKFDAQGQPVVIQIPQIVAISGTLGGGIPIAEFHTGLAAGYERAEILLCGSAATCRVDLLAQHVELFPAASASPTGELFDSVGDEWQVEAEFLAAVRSARRGKSWQVRPNFPEAARYMRKMQAIDDVTSSAARQPWAKASSNSAMPLRSVLAK